VKVSGAPHDTRTSILPARKTVSRCGRKAISPYHAAMRWLDEGYDIAGGWMETPGPPPPADIAEGNDDMRSRRDGTSNLRRKGQI
jgi:hypothetical protein